MTAARSRDLAVIVPLFLAAVIFFSIGHDFRLGFHPDEVLWVQNITALHWDLEQPLLLREATLALTWVLRIVDPQRVAEVGRLICAAMASVGIAGLWVVTAERAGRGAALIAAAIGTVSPLVAIHAHYFKDDAPLFAFCVLAILAFQRFLAAVSPTNILLLGACLGGAISSKESGLFLFPVLGLALLLQPRRTWRQSLAGLAAASFIAGVLAAIINMPMLLEPARTAYEFGGETNGISAGHWDGVFYGYGFHAVQSLWYGVGPVLLAGAGIGLVLGVLRRRLADPLDRLMLIYAVVYYGVIEISPMKPWPDADRYALPLVLPLAYFFALAVHEAGEWLREAQPQRRQQIGVAFYTFAAAVVATSAATSVRLLANLGDDTRDRADRFMLGKDASLLTEWYGTSIGKSVRSLADLDLDRIGPDVRYLVASSFMYGRYAYGADIGSTRNATAQETWARYQKIFEHPYCEVRPRFTSYAFSNPVLRIVDLRAVPAASASESIDHAPLAALCDADKSETE